MGGSVGSARIAGTVEPRAAGRSVFVVDRVLPAVDGRPSTSVCRGHCCGINVQPSTQSARRTETGGDDAADRLPGRSSTTRVKTSPASAVMLASDMPLSTIEIASSTSNVPDRTATAGQATAEQHRREPCEQRGSDVNGPSFKVIYVRTLGAINRALADHPYSGYLIRPSIECLQAQPHTRQRIRTPPGRPDPGNERRHPAQRGRPARCRLTHRGGTEHVGVALVCGGGASGPGALARAPLPIVGSAAVPVRNHSRRCSDRVRARATHRPSRG